MKKQTVKLGLAFALMAMLFTACQKDALINNAVENIQTQSPKNIDLRNTITQCGITISTSGLTVTLIDDSNSANTIVTVTDPGWNFFVEDLCNEHTGDDCTSGSSVTAPSSGNYVVHVQSGGGNCTIDIFLGGCTTDNDNDGVCGDVDCNDNDASVGAAQASGTSCNDGNPNTCNDVIQADGCTCQGVVNDCGETITACDIVVSISGQTITLLESNSPASPPFTIVTVTDPMWNFFVEILCNDHTGDDCELGKSVTVPFGGPYVIHVQSGGGNCTIDVQI